MKLLERLNSNTERPFKTSSNYETTSISEMNLFMRYEDAKQELKNLNILPNISSLQNLNHNENDIRIIITECQTKAIYATTVARNLNSLRPQDYTPEEKLKISLAAFQIGNIYVELEEKIKEVYPKISNFSIESKHPIPSDRTQIIRYLAYIVHELKNEKNNFAILFATAGINTAKAINVIEEAIQALGNESTHNAIEGMRREIVLVEEAADLAYKKVTDRITTREHRMTVDKSYEMVKKMFADAQHVTIVQGDQINYHGSGSGPGTISESSGSHLWKWISWTPLWVGSLVVVGGGILWYSNGIGLIMDFVEYFSQNWVETTMEFTKRAAVGTAKGVANATGATYAYNSVTGAVSYVSEGFDYARSTVMGAGMSVAGAFGINHLLSWARQTHSVSIY